MGLVGRLSNPDLQTLFQTLMVTDWKQEAPGVRRAQGVAPDGRHRFGTVRDAIVQVLTVEPLGLRARDVHARVELLLDESVSRSSVNSMLALRCQGENKLFNRLGRGHYRLATRL